MQQCVGPHFQEAVTEDATMRSRVSLSAVFRSWMKFSNPDCVVLRSAKSAIPDETWKLPSFFISTSTVCFSLPSLKPARTSRAETHTERRGGWAREKGTPTPVKQDWGQTRQMRGQQSRSKAEPILGAAR